MAGPSASTPVLTQTPGRSPFLISARTMIGFMPWTSPASRCLDFQWKQEATSLRRRWLQILIPMAVRLLSSAPTTAVSIHCRSPGMARAADDALRDRRLVSSTPALIPLPDGGYDIVFGSWDGDVYCLRGDDPNIARWQVNTGHLIWSSPVAADIDGDGEFETIVANDRLHVLKADGAPVRPFPLSLGGMSIGAPAVGDLKGNGELVIVVAADRLSRFKQMDRCWPAFRSTPDLHSGLLRFLPISMAMAAMKSLLATMRAFSMSSRRQENRLLDFRVDSAIDNFESDCGRPGRRQIAGTRRVHLRRENSPLAYTRLNEPMDEF